MELCGHANTHSLPQFTQVRRDQEGADCVGGTDVVSLVECIVGAGSELDCFDLLALNTENTLL
jgi:hypothetical protein